MFINGLIPGEVIYDDVLFFQAKLLVKQNKYEQALLSLSKIIAADNQGFLTDDIYFMMAEIYHNKIKNRKRLKNTIRK